jgi:uncharacterized protein YdiU (UPF0061 family)
MSPISAQTYQALPEGMYTRQPPVVPKSPALLALNQPLLQHYGVDPEWFSSPQGLAVLSGAATDPDTAPLALAYSGHQFGSWVPLLGDGRAHMLGQMSTSDGLIDVQLKGSGATAYSRGGDGRATQSSVLREYLISEAMAGLGIPTTGSLAIVATGDMVIREQPRPGAILVRTATSHIRVGSFQHARNNLDGAAVQALADHVIERNFPQLASRESPYEKLLVAVAEKQARLIAQWMLVGFIHGVMNTDNMSIVGETIDFGPCAFMDEFSPDKVFSSIDRQGRYAWGQQSSIGLWNLTRFAETLLPLFHDDTDSAVEIAKERLSIYQETFQRAFTGGFVQKLGLPEDFTTDGADFIQQTIQLLADSAIDFTVFFNELTRVANGAEANLVTQLFTDVKTGDQWFTDWTELRTGNPTAQAGMRTVNPVIIARNHQVERALGAAEADAEFEPFHQLAKALRNPFDESLLDSPFTEPPLPGERIVETFCGT